VDGAGAVVVLGYRDRGQHANLINRWRVRAGLRSLEATDRQSRLILCGGVTAGRHSEAEIMAQYARSVRGYEGQIVVEQASRTTWENVQNLITLVEDAPWIAIVSHPFHAYKARVYLHRQRPDLAARLVRGADYRPGEWLVAKPLLAVHGHWSNRRLSGHDPRQP
jgi:uncharacterized SAM-binding protein YcdF (DUF218 family)